MINADGHIQFLDFNSDPVSLGSQINIRAESSSVAKASKLLGFDVPDLGPLKASMVINSEGGDFSGRDINIRIGRQRALLLDLVGSIGKIPLTNDPVSGIDLKALVKAQSTQALSVLAKGSKIPDMGPLSGRFNINGNSSAVSIGEIVFDAGYQNKLTASVRGNIRQLALGNNPFKGVNITLSAAAPSTSALSDADGSFGVEALTLETEQSNIMAVKITGGVGDIMHGNEINVDAFISIGDLERLGQVFDKELPAFGAIELQGKLTGSNERASFDGLFKFNETEEPAS